MAPVGKEVGASIDHQPRAKELEDIKRPEQPWVGLEKLPDETLQAVPQAHHVEAAPHRPGLALVQADQIGDEKPRHGEAFVELDGVATNAVAEIDGPGQTG